MKLTSKLALCFLAAGGLWELSKSAYAVPPGGEAVVVRLGDVHRTAGPGPNFKLPLIEQVAIYETIIEQREQIPGDFVVAGCNADIELVFRIEDVLAFHNTSDYRQELFALSPTIVSALRSVENGADNLEVEAQQQIQAALTDERPAGIRIARALVDMGGCGPQPPRTTLRREPMPPISTSSQLGELRADIPTFWFTSADDVRIEITGAIASYSVDDTEKFNTCYQNSDHATARIVSLVTPSLRALGHTLNNDALHEMSGRLPRFLREKGIDHLQDCGVELSSVDYSGANLTRVTEIVCDATSTDPDCVEQ